MNDRQRAFLVAILGILIVGLVAFGWSYAVISLVLLDLNPAHWDILSRAAWMVLAILSLGGWLIWRSLGHGE